MKHCLKMGSVAPNERILCGSGQFAEHCEATIENLLKLETLLK